MVAYSDVVTAAVSGPNEPRLPISGVVVTVLTKNNALADLTADDGTALPNPFKTGSFGAVHFNVPDPGDVYTIQYRYGGRLLREDNAIIGVPVSFTLNALFTLPPGVAGITAIMLSLSPSQQQSLRDAFATLPDTSEIAIRSRGEFVQQNDALGQFIGQTLFGSTTDSQLSVLFAIARDNTMIPYSSTLTPIAVGDFLING